jgi:hypothetical protein
MTGDVLSCISVVMDYLTFFLQIIFPNKSLNIFFLKFITLVFIIWLVCFIGGVL